MCKFTGKSHLQILCKLSKTEILRLFSIVHVAMETKKTSNFTRQSKSSISTFFTCQVSACELQPFSCHNLANDIYSQTAKTVFSHLNRTALLAGPWLNADPCVFPTLYPHRHIPLFSLWPSGINLPAVVDTVKIPRWLLRRQSRMVVL